MNNFSKQCTSYTFCEKYRKILFRNNSFLIMLALDSYILFMFADANFKDGDAEMHSY